MTLEEFKKKKKNGSLINSRSTQSQGSTSTKMSFEEFKNKKQNGTLLNTSKTSEVTHVKEEQPQIKASDVRKIKISDFALMAGDTGKKVRLDSEINNLEKQIQQKESDYVKANNISDWNKKNQTKSELQKELNTLRQNLDTNKQARDSLDKGMSKGTIMTPEQLSEHYDNMTIPQKIDKAIKWDIPQTAEKVGRTGMDLIGNVATGVTRGMEGYVDAAVGVGGTALSGIANLIGKKEVAQNIKNKAEEIAGYGFSKGMQNLVDEKSQQGAEIYNPSILGVDVRDAAQEIARMYAVAKTGGLPGLMISATGGNIEEALNEGESLGRATAYGAITGSLEGVVEKMFDPAKILGGGLKTIGKGFLGKIAEATVGEGAEEGITAALNPFVKMLTYKGEAENPFGSWENFKNYLRDIGQSVYQGAIIGGLTLGVSAPGNVDLQKSFSTDVYKAAEKLQGVDQVKKNEIANTILEGAKSVTGQDIKNIREYVDVYKRNPQNSQYIPQNLSKNTNLSIQRENVTGLPKANALNATQNVPSQQINTTLPTQAEMAQKANTEQIAKNIENSNILEYNNNRGVENGEKTNGERYTSEVRDGLHQESSPENRRYNRAEYEQWEQSLKPISRERLTPEEATDIDNAQKEYSKTVNLIDENENSNKYSGGVSLTQKGKINISRQQAEYFGLKNMIEHEVVEDDILYDDVANDILTPAIELIMQDTKFDDQKKAFWAGQTDNMPVDVLIAKDLLCDRFAEIKNNTKMKYDNVLSPEVNATVDMALQNYYKQVYGKELNINNTEADKQSAFSMPKNEVQTFASSTAPRPYMDLNRYTSRNNDSKTEKVGLTDIQNAINDIVTVKTGKFRQQAYGIYKTNNEIIRLKETKDIPVALHELTHHLDKKYNLSSSDKAFKELENIAVVGKNASKQTVVKEGVAEFGRYYMTDKEYAKEIAPFYYDAFERALDNDPDMKSKVDNIRQMVSDYLEQSPLNRLSSNIDYGDSDMSLWEKGKESIVKTAKNFRKNFVDELDPLKKIVEEISSGDKLMTKENAYKLLRLNNGVTGKVQVALEYGVLNKNGEKVGKSLKEILKPVTDQQKEFVAYLTALRAKDLQGRGIESGMLARDVDDVIKAYNTNGTFNLAAKELYEFQNKILETTLIDSGIITREALDSYNKNNPHYVPFYRVMDENFKQSKSSKSKTPKRIKGSTRDIINPLESIIKNTYSYMQMAERNDAFKTLFDMANKYDGTGKWFDKVPTDMIGTKITAEDVKGILEQLNLSEEDVNYNEIFTTIFKPANNQKGNIVTVMEKGKPVHYEINDKELFDILSPTGKGENIIVKLLSPASKALRVGATHTPEFVLRNPLRDTIDAGIYSKNGFIPFVDTIKGIFDVVGRSDLYYRWLQSGGSGSTYTNAQRPVLQKTLKGLTEETTNEKNIKEALKGAVELVKHPLRTYLDVAGTISNVAEEATRLGEFRRALEKGKGEKTAALDSREITLDFSRGGKVAKDINKVVAFFNAELQGLDKMFTSFKERPLATTVKGLAYLTIPAMILRALQDEEKLDKVPQWEKDEYFIIFAGDTPIKIPKPQGLGQLFATFPERIIDFIRTQDKDAFDGFVQRLITSYVPIDSTTSIFPNFFLPLIENSANYSFFRQQPVVKQSLQNRSPRYQYDENTSTIAKKIGGITNTSPKKIDNLISGYFGNLGKDIANIAGAPFDVYDSITGKGKGEKEYQSLNSTLKKIPVVKGFIASDTASKAVDKFYEGKEKASADYADAKFKYSETKMTAKQEKELEYLKSVNSLYNKAYNDMKDIEEQIDDVKTSNRSNEYKKTMLDKLQKQKNKIAEDTKKESDKLKAKNTLITQAEQRAKLKK